MSEKPPASHEKVSHWDRPKPPHDWRWVVGGIGRTLITLGLLMFAFVAYQLWGTGIQTAQAQRSLSKEFDEQIADIDPVTTTTPTTTTAPPDATTLPVDPAAPTTTVAPVLPEAKPIPPEEKGVARLIIPRMDLNRIVVEGATADALTKGPGHFPETPLPGQLGNAAIAGHRTTHLHPFFDIDKLQPGDEITVITLNGRYVYHVTGTEVVGPEDYAAVIPTTDVTKATLTLVSCTPRYSATNRIVVHADLVPGESDALTEAAPVVSGNLPDDPAVTLPAEDPVTVLDTDAATATTVAGATTDSVPSDTTPANTVATDTAAVPPAATPTTPDAFSDGWFSDSSAVVPAILWGLLLAAIGYGVYWLSHKVRRYWVGILAGFVPFIVVLYFFYENVNRLLPPNL
ncbi:MAG TPA: class E sortase [Ilumatobacteraceae bacterium]|nr:class E sortase [Ilumatobacteraceae bacterium]